MPTGRETCGWCMMLASRGFAFTSAAAASAGSHEGCDCVVVPGTPETRVEGYDHEGMAERWQQCVECVDGEWLTRQARAEWDAMDEAERAKWAGKAGRKTREAIESLGEERSKELGLGEAASEEAAFKRYRAHRLAREAMEEVERRDPAWAYRGKHGLVTKQQGAKPWKKEEDAASILVRNGFNVHFVKEPKDVKIYDAFLNGVSWEFKIPEGFNDKTVKNQFKKAIGKGTGSLLLSNLVNGATCDEMVHAIDEMMASQEFGEIRRVLFVDRSGEIRAFKR